MNMLFGRVVEHGLRSAHYKDVVEQLYAEHLGRQGGLGSEHGGADGLPFLLAATIGATDLLEVAFSSSLTDLRRPPAQSGYVLWRPTGTYVPTKRDLTRLRGSGPLPACLASPERAGRAGLRALRELVGPDGGPPLIGVVFSQVSDLTLLLGDSHIAGARAQPKSENAAIGIDHLGVKLVASLCDPDLPFWRSSAMSSNMKVLPLLGLDLPDVVWFIRAGTIDDIACFIAGLRMIEHKDVKLHENKALHSKVAKGHLRHDYNGESWQRAALFSATQTVIGLPWRRVEKSYPLELGDGLPGHHVLGDKWSLRFLIRGQFCEGRRASNQKPMEYDGHELVFDSVEHTFGFRDVLWQGTQATDNEGKPKPLTSSGLRALVNALAKPKNIDASLSQGPTSGLDTNTLIAISTSEPTLVQRPANLFDVLGQQLHQIMRSVVDYHRKTDRTTHTHSWSAVWHYFRESRAKHGIKCASTLDNGVRNLFGAVLDNLSENLLELLDVVDAVQVFIDALKEINSIERADEIGAIFGATLEPQHIKDTYSVTERFFLSRIRRSNPLQLQRTSLGFEGHAGYRMARDAFGAFVRDLLVLIQRRSAVVVTDFADQSTHITPLIPNRLWALGVSTEILDEPALWLGIFHEAAHIVLHEEPVRGADQPNCWTWFERADQSDLSDYTRSYYRKYLKGGVHRRTPGPERPIGEAICDIFAVYMFVKLGGDYDTAWALLREAIRLDDGAAAGSLAAQRRSDWHLLLSDELKLSPPPLQLCDSAEPTHTAIAPTLEAVSKAAHILSFVMSIVDDCMEQAAGDGPVAHSRLNRLQWFCSNIKSTQTDDTTKSIVYRMFDERSREESADVFVKLACDCGSVDVQRGE